MSEDFIIRQAKGGYTIASHDNKKVEYFLPIDEYIRDQEPLCFTWNYKKLCFEPIEAPL